MSRAAARAAGMATSHGTNSRWEIAEVINFYAASHCADVRTIKGRMINAVPQLKSSPGEFSCLTTGTFVVVSHDLGFMPVILGTICLDTGNEDTSVDITNSQGIGADNPTQANTAIFNFAPDDAPKDMAAGDWAHTGPLGNFVSLLGGAISAIGSPNAQIRTLGLSGTIQQLCQRIMTFTDFGKWSVENDEGRTSFTLRAGHNQGTQTGMDEQHWTIKLDLGATGDLFNFELTTPEEELLFRLHVAADGHVQVFGLGGFDIHSGPEGTKESTSFIEGNENVTVEGAATKQVAGEINEATSQKKNLSVAVDYTRTIGNDSIEHTNNNKIGHVGGNETEIIAGGPVTSAAPGNVARDTRILNGDWKIDLGNPDQQASPAAMAGLKAKSYFGNLEFEAGQEFKASGTLGASLKSDAITEIDGTLITIGGAISPLPMWLEYLTAASTVWHALGVALAKLPPLQDGAAAANAFAALVDASLAGAPFSSLKAKNG